MLVSDLINKLMEDAKTNIGIKGGNDEYWDGCVAGLEMLKEKIKKDIWLFVPEDEMKDFRIVWLIRDWEYEHETVAKFLNGCTITGSCLDENKKGLLVTEEVNAANIPVSLSFGCSYFQVYSIMSIGEKGDDVRDEKE